MSRPQPPADDLRRHLGEEIRSEPAGPCPSPEDWWEGWVGSLPDEAFGRLVDHAASCPQCSLNSRLAREMAQRLEPQRYRGRRALRSPWVMRGAYAAAAAILIAVAVLTIGPWRSHAPDSVMRTPIEEPLRSLQDEGRPLARASCVLRWTAGPEGTIYHIEVTDEAMRLLASGSSLVSPEFHVPEAALADVPPGARIVWQVHAIQPDGRRSASHTFFNVLD